MTKSNSTATATGGSQPRARRKRKRLAPSQKYEVFTAMLTSSATQRELAEKYGVDRTTISSICATAKQTSHGEIGQAAVVRAACRGQAVASS